MRPHPKRARTDRNSPRAWATDMRSGFVGNLENAQWQHEWQGPRLIDTKLLVYPDQLDNPQRQLGVNILVPDGLPIENPRPGNDLAAEQVVTVTADYDAVAGDIISCDGTFTVTLPIAEDIADRSVTVNNNGSGTITVATTDSQTIDDESTQTVAADESLTVISDGSNWTIWSGAWT